MSTAGGWNRDPLTDADRRRLYRDVPWGEFDDDRPTADRRAPRGRDDDDASGGYPTERSAGDGRGSGRRSGRGALPGRSYDGGDDGDRVRWIEGQFSSGPTDEDDDRTVTFPIPLRRRDSRAGSGEDAPPPPGRPYDGGSYPPPSYGAPASGGYGTSAGGRDYGAPAGRDYDADQGRHSGYPALPAGGYDSASGSFAQPPYPPQPAYGAPQPAYGAPPPGRGYDTGGYPPPPAYGAPAGGGYGAPAGGGYGTSAGGRDYGAPAGRDYGADQGRHSGYPAPPGGGYDAGSGSFAQPPYPPQPAYPPVTYPPVYPALPSGRDHSSDSHSPSSYGAPPPPSSYDSGGYTPPSTYGAPSPPSSYDSGGYTPPSTYGAPPPPSSYDSGGYTPPSTYGAPPPPSSYDASQGRHSAPPGGGSYDGGRYTPSTYGAPLPVYPPAYPAPPTYLALPSGRSYDADQNQHSGYATPPGAADPGTGGHQVPTFTPTPYPPTDYSSTPYPPSTYGTPAGGNDDADQGRYSTYTASPGGREYEADSYSASSYSAPPARDYGASPDPVSSYTAPLPRADDADGYSSTAYGQAYAPTTYPALPSGRDYDADENRYSTYSTSLRDYDADEGRYSTYTASPSGREYDADDGRYSTYTTSPRDYDADEGRYATYTTSPGEREYDADGYSPSGYGAASAREYGAGPDPASAYTAPFGRADDDYTASSYATRDYGRYDDDAEGRAAAPVREYVDDDGDVPTESWDYDDRRDRRAGRHRVDTNTRLTPVSAPTTRSGGKRAAVRTRRHVPLWQELPLLIIIAFSLALMIKTFLLQAFFIPSGSMEETLLIRDRVLVNKVVYEFRTPQRGEVIVFRGTDSWAPESELPQTNEGFLAKTGHLVGSVVGLSEPDEKDFIKRVIGQPGDVVQCCDPDGSVLVNGKALDEPYIFENNPIDQRTFGPITVPSGRLFVMGDHRGNSQDSRAYISDQFKGTIPIDQVIGRAFIKVWPVSSWDDLPVPDTFDSVPSARADGLPPRRSEDAPRTAGLVEGPTFTAILLPFLRRRRRTQPARRFGVAPVRRPMPGQGQPESGPDGRAVDARP